MYRCGAMRVVEFTSAYYLSTDDDWLEESSSN